MADQSKIEWCDATWNPIVGCSIVSRGCTNCYAMKMARRIEVMQDRAFDAVEARKRSPYAGLTQNVKAGAVWNGKVALASDDTLTAPLHWKKPRRIFVNSMGDLFHEAVPDEWIDRVFAVMALAPHHTFQVLTKRSGRMRGYLSAARAHPVGLAAMDQTLRSMAENPTSNVGAGCILQGDIAHLKLWPLPNVWLGVSAEDQRRADERIPDLLATPAAVRFVCAEPMLGPIDFQRIDGGALDSEATGIKLNALTGGRKSTSPWHLDWIIVGGESGPNARANWIPNVRAIVQQCKAAGTAVYVKQLGANVQDRNDAGFEGCDPSQWPDIDPNRVEEDLDGTRDDYQGAPVRVHLRDRKGADMAEWPEDLRIRQFPEIKP